MKRLIWMLSICLIMPSTALAFISWGRIGPTLEYENFEPLVSGDGYSFTLVNTGKRAVSDTCVLIYGLDISDQRIYEHELYIEFLEAGGRYSTVLPGSEQQFWDVSFEVLQPCRQYIPSPYPRRFSY